MPATRSQSQSQVLSQLPVQKKKKKANAVPVPVTDASSSRSVIGAIDSIEILSSDGEGQTRPVKRGTRSKVPFIPTGEILEISSDEEDGKGKKKAGGSGGSSQRANAALQKQLKALQTENLRLQKDNARLKVNVNELGRSYKDTSDELLQLRQYTASGKVKPAIEVSQLEDITCCEICAGRLWTPNILECGHIFCRTCIQDWFSTTLTKHLTDNPHANAHYGPRPKYSCPTCRAEMHFRPTEVFALKELVHTVAKSLGEASPQKEAPARRGAVRHDPWSGFFPTIR